MTEIFDILAAVTTTVVFMAVIAMTSAKAQKATK